MCQQTALHAYQLKICLPQQYLPKPRTIPIDETTTVTLLHMHAPHATKVNDYTSPLS